MHEENENTDKNMYKIKAFKSAIKVIQQLDHPIRSIEEAKNVSTSLVLQEPQPPINDNRSEALAMAFPDEYMNNSFRAVKSVC